MSEINDLLAAAKREYFEGEHPLPPKIHAAVVAWLAAEQPTCIADSRARVVEGIVIGHLDPMDPTETVGTNRVGINDVLPAGTRVRVIIPAKP
jgi:hypothetical protein